MTEDRKGLIIFCQIYRDSHLDNAKLEAAIGNFELTALENEIAERFSATIEVLEKEN